jgi:hypothetical protein
MYEDQRTETENTNRRAILATVGTTALGAVAGCLGGDDSKNGDDSIPGLQLSLRADSGVTTDDQGRVETWADQTDNGHDFSSLRPAARPGLSEETASGTPALTFNGEGQFLLREDTTGIPNDSARTFVVVSRLTDPAARSPMFMQGRLNATGGNSNAYGIEANTFNTAGERFGVYLISVANDSERETDTNYHIHTIRTESFPALEDIRNTTTYYVDGAETPFEHTGGGTFNSPFDGSASSIGSFSQEQPGVTHTGEIAEIRAYDRALTEDQRSTVESELADRYGIGIE